MISSHLQQLAEGQVVLERCAPTGAAAFSINGSTIHSLFRLPVLKGAQVTMERLPPATLQSLQARLTPVQYFIIDEKSMISLATLHMIDTRLCEAFPRDAHQAFSGRSIILLGDFWQLAPVCDKALYHQVYKYAPPVAPVAPPVAPPVSPPSNVHYRLRRLLKNAYEKTSTVRGFDVYRLFTRTRELTLQQRQDAGQVAFASALEVLRNNEVQASHWRTLISRCATELSSTEISRFDGAIRLYPTNKMVDEYNHQSLRDNGAPVLRIKASHSSAAAASVDSDLAGGLSRSLDISIGCKLMLLENFCTELGVVNGTQCIHLKLETLHLDHCISVTI